MMGTSDQEKKIKSRKKKKTRTIFCLKKKISERTFRRIKLMSCLCALRVKKCCVEGKKIEFLDPFFLTVMIPENN